MTFDSFVSSHSTKLLGRVRARLGGALGCKISEALTLRHKQVQGWHGMILRACASLCFTPEMPHCLILILVLLILPLSPQPSWVRGSFGPAFRSLPPSLMPLTFLWSPLDQAALSCRGCCCFWTQQAVPISWPSLPSFPLTFSISPYLAIAPGSDHMGPVTSLLFLTFGASPHTMPWSMF